MKSEARYKRVSLPLKKENGEESIGVNQVYERLVEVNGEGCFSQALMNIGTWAMAQWEDSLKTCLSKLHSSQL